MTRELLSPAGSPEALRAAVQNGAGAVYLGWGDFNARRNARNFSDEEFADALSYCHLRGVRVFLTLNTLLTDRELPRALETARKACRLGVDAVLVQDWGLLDLLRQALPDLPLHASTQMSIFTSGGANEVASDGCERVVLARECSREDTEAICAACPAEIEIFAHGALCMCYSGQCAMSAVVGGRSGNRGTCAQPCRLPYGVDEPAANRYPLSLKDNSLAQDLSGIRDVACLKLEGRMKRPEYVAVVTGIYARLLEENRSPTPAEERELELAFSRSGFTDAYWRGRRGVEMFGTRPENAPEPRELFERAKATYEKDNRRTVPVRFACTIQPHAPCVLTVDDGTRAVTVTGPAPEAARTRALTAEEVAERLGKTGGTAFHCAGAAVEVGEGLSLPASAINALRREALASLAEARCAPPLRREAEVPPLRKAECAQERPALTVSLTHAAQLTPALLEEAPARIYLPLELLADLPHLPEADTQWCAILPRVWRDRDEADLRRRLEKARELGIDGVLVGNIGHLPLTRGLGLSLYGDFGLNVYNSRSLDYLRRKGLASACLSFELRFSQIRDLKKLLPTEALVYGRLPLMITENCLVQNQEGCGLSAAGPLVPAGAPCRESHALHDRTGAAFPLLPAFGHRTEVQNSRPLWLADRETWKRLGLAFARLRFTTERPEACVEILRAYRTGGAPPEIFTRGLYERGVE
ncbi:U32 family peptidase [Dysosmobacter sp. NSJ-60]|nr:U32 family peptidase [Dysosmobacter hominis]